MQFIPHEYQRYALSWLIRRSLIDGHEGSAYFLDPGLGKTALTLAWVKFLKDLGVANSVLVVAPLRVISSVWPDECKKWDQFNELTCSVVHGTKRLEAMGREADIHLINPEAVSWLERQDKKFDVLVVDESSKFKNWSAKRTKSLKKMVPDFKYRLLLTGTPSPNSLEDLFSQMFILDQGKAFGSSITSFRNRYFYRGGYGGYKWTPFASSQDYIESKIKDSCLRLSAEDHLDLPTILLNDVWVDLPKDCLVEYKRLEKEMFLLLEGEDSVTATNAGSKYLSCRQFANGGIYDEDRTSHVIHNEKVSAMIEIIEELQGKPVIVAFQFHHDLERIRSRLHAPSIDGRTKPEEANVLINKWNAGELPVLAVQPQSLSHGVNMQHGPGRDIIWFGLTDNLETYQQLNARVHRQGVTGGVRIHHLLARETVDLAIKDRLSEKGQNQSSLLESLNRYRLRN